MFLYIQGDGERPGREFKLISHRGGKGFGPENTLRSLQAALDFGVEMIETDVRMTSDGVPVIQHSPFIGLRLLSRMRWDEVREKEPELPSLYEYLDLAANRCALNLEIKRCDADVVAEAVRAARPSFPVLVSSFDEDFLVDFANTGSEATLGLLTQYELLPERMLEDAERCGAKTLLPASFAVRNALLETAHEAGLEVIAWTVNSTEILRDLVLAGIDGVITDTYPELEAFLAAGLAGVGAEGAGAPQDASLQP